MQHVDGEHFALVSEIAQFLVQSEMELSAGEQPLMKRFGLTVTQYWALVHLNDADGRSLSELADLLLCDKSNVTSVVDKFEKSGLAERRSGKNGDRRYIRVVLTARGQQLRTQAIAAQERLLKTRFQGVEIETLRRLHGPLQQITHILQTQQRRGEVSAMIEDAARGIPSSSDASAEPTKA